MCLKLGDEIVSDYMYLAMALSQLESDEDWRNVLKKAIVWD